MSWSHDHYPKAHWCGAQTRNPDVNRCPKSLWCFGLLKAWVSDFDPANSSLPYVHSELISDISVNDPYLNPYLIWWSPIFDPIILNPYLTFLVICWWYVPNDIHFISLFFLPSFAPQRQRQPSYGRQDSPSNFTPVLWPQATITRHRAINAEFKLIRHLRPRGFQATKKGHETHETYNFRG
jgi:hypothetical protein